MENKEKIVPAVDTKSSEDFWDTLYKNNDMGWDMKQVSPPLKKHIDAISDKEIEILIPGCGNAYEAEYLLDKGFKHVTLVDISPTLVGRLKEKFSNKPIRILNEDFFEHKGKYDLILEQTFFCAINPALRAKYVEKCYSLLNKKGKIAGVMFNVIFPKEGPPHGGTNEEYEALFKPKFTFLQFDKCDISIPPRQGNEVLIEFEKKS